VSARTNNAARLETSAWIALAACITIVPLAVSKLPFLEQPLTFTVFAFPQSATLAIGVAVALGLWGCAVSMGWTRVSLSRTMIPFALLLAWAGVATVAAYEPMRSLLGASGSSLSLLLLAAYVAVFFLTVQLVDSGGRMRVLTWCVIASGSVVAIPALLQQLFAADIFGLPLGNDWILGRGFSTMGNPDHLGTFLVVPVILSAVIVLYQSEVRERVVAGVCLATTLTAMAGTLTRGALLSVIAGAALIALLQWRSGAKTERPGRRAAIVAGVFVLAIAVGLVASDPWDLAHRVDELRGSLRAETSTGFANTLSSGRIKLWTSSLRIAGQRPLTGTGPAAFELGWYPNAIDPTSAGGEGALADEPHSLPVYYLATMGVPGLLAYLAAALGALAIGWKNVVSQVRERAPSGTRLYYLAWTMGATALHLALLVAAVSTPIMMYAFLSLAVLLRPSARPIEGRSALVRWTPAVLAFCLAIALGTGISPQLYAETALARANRSGSLSEARLAALAVPWNLDVQKAYFHMSVEQVNASIGAGRTEAPDDVSALIDELTIAGDLQPRELYYPSVRAQVLTQASEKLRDVSYAEDAIRAADDALAIMPAHIPTRVNKALALSDLKRYGDMADTLSGYWENETSSAYPGILYAQALALSGKPDEARAVFDRLKQKFPDDASIARIQADTESLLQK